MSSGRILFLLLFLLYLSSGVVVLGQQSSAPAACEELLPGFLSELNARGNPEPLPISADLIPRPIPAAGFLLEKLREGVYSVLDSIYYSIIVFRGTHLVLVDFPAPAGGGTGNVTGFASVIEAAALQVLNGVVPQRIDFVYSHSHFDHIGTATVTKNALRKRFPRTRFRIWASRDAATFIRKPGSDRAPVPTVMFRSFAILQVGGRRSPLRIILKVVGGHTEDDVLVYIPPSSGQQGVTYLVDMIYPGWSAPFNFGLTQNLRQYIDAHDLLLRLNFKIFVGGHLTRLGTKRDVEINKNYTLSVLGAVRQAQAAAPSFEDVVRPLGLLDPSRRAFGNILFALDAFFDTIDRECARRLIVQGVAAWRPWRPSLSLIALQLATLFCSMPSPDERKA